MDVVVKENIANKHMHNPPYVVGVLSAPDTHYHPVLYSHWQATKDFNKLEHDIFVQQSKHKRADRKKTPSSVFYVLGTSAILVLWKIGKHVFKK